MKKIALFALSLAVLAGCAQKEMTTPVTPSEAQKVTLTFDVNAPDTKIALDYTDTSLVWTGGETMRLIFGKTGEGGVDNNVNPTLASVADGVFSGTIELPGEYGLENLQGFVIPGLESARFDWQKATDSRILVQVPAEQTQKKAGEPNWDYAPFFADLSGTEFVQKADGSYGFAEPVTLRSFADLMRFNVYGKHPSMSDDEVLKSVKVTALGYDGITKLIISGSVSWVLEGTGTGLNTGGTDYVKVTLEEAVTVADKTKETGVKVFAGIVFGGTRYIGMVEVETNKATYVKAFDSPKKYGQKSNKKFNIFPVNLDLSTFSTESGLEYSTDNEEWFDAIPETFENLYVRTKNYVMTGDDLSVIKNAIDAQSSAVTLDLSGTMYKSLTFPATFAGTEAAPNTKLKAVKFPKNVTAVAADAFYWCEALESVDLSQIKTLGNNSFRNTGLVTLRVDKQVTSMGTYVFANCFKLKELYFNAQDPIFKEFGESKRKNFYTFCFTSSSVAHTHDLVATIGPNIQLPRYCFRQNANLSTIIFEYNGSSNLRMGNNSLLYAFYLHTVICKGTAGGCVYVSDGLANIGSKVSSDVNKYIVIPDDKTANYSKLMTSGVNAEEGQGWANCGFTLIEQSAYDALETK